MLGKQGGFTGFSSESVAPSLFRNYCSNAWGKRAGIQYLGEEICQAPSEKLPALVYLGQMNKLCLPLFLSTQIHVYNCSFKWLSGLPLCLFGLESTSFAAHTGFILSLGAKRNRDIGKTFELCRTRGLYPQKSSSGWWVPVVPRTNLLGRLRSRLGQNSASAQQVSSQPGLSQADFGFCICEQVLSSSGNG